MGTRDGTSPNSDCNSSSDNFTDDKRGVLSSEGIAGAVTYSEGGTGADKGRDSVEGALDDPRAEP